MCFRNQITLSIGLSAIFRSCIRFPAAILEKRVRADILRISAVFLGKTYSGKVTKAFITIQRGFRSRR